MEGRMSRHDSDRKPGTGRQLELPGASIMIAGQSDRPGLIIVYDVYHRGDRPGPDLDYIFWFLSDLISLLNAILRLLLVQRTSGCAPHVENGCT